ncbi:hypothetical protein GCM10011352_35750 [Marinobacterium zhoushanense]|uniref:DUF4010 domain-containing protein n=1 Tax=Marinobacterium zhoushanense TaxID=1679163 RepID=A0ABQ1KRV2_9GAMM|nr:hypothetical protein [Marinobacterium zhoushanense]GGC06387.1 hypothetical protein GCM10011352_35750 [Marinobacterium zhoushanense]
MQLIRTLNDTADLTTRLSGVLIFAAMLLALADTFQLIEATHLATVLAWGFVLVELRNLTGKQRRLILMLSAAGVLFSCWAWFKGGQVAALDILSEHIKLAMLLAAVNFIRLVSRLEPAPDHKGVRSFLTTLGGMHFFSSVANFSSVLMVGEQLYRNERLSALSQVILARGFSLAVLWSPFLSILPMVLDKVPGSDIYAVYPFTIALAIVGLLLTLVESRYRRPEELNSYAGYPIKRSTLLLPAMLISTVLLTAWLAPDLPTIGVVALLALLVPFSILVLKSGMTSASRSAAKHVVERLPDARVEIALFLTAGLLAAGVKACIALGLVDLPFQETNAHIASFVLVSIVLLAYLGIHQFALVAIFMGFFAEITTTPTLMAIAYILGTSLSMSGSIFSGLNFILQARFRCSIREILANNSLYTLLMLTASVALIYLLAAFGIH